MAYHIPSSKCNDIREAQTSRFLAAFCVSKGRSLACSMNLRIAYDYNYDNLNLYNFVIIVANYEVDNLIIKIMYCIKYFLIVYNLLFS